MLRVTLADFARRAGCTDTSPISPHRLRHTWASEMLRCGISLPALKELMGHKDIRMTLRYYMRKVDMCSWRPKWLLVNAPRWVTQHNILG
jgi:integrase/recombinase XerD